MFIVLCLLKINRDGLIVTHWEDMVKFLDRAYDQATEELSLLATYKGSAENPKWNSISRNGIKIRNGTAFSFRYIKMSRFTLRRHVQLYQRAQQYRLNLLYD